MRKILLVATLGVVFSASVFGSNSTLAREVTLTWDANSEPDLSHYIVYWGTESGKYTQNSGAIGLVTEYKLSIPNDGKKYYFVVTAVGTSKLESDYSNEVVAEPGQIAEYLYMPPAAVKNVTMALYQETLPDGSIAIYRGSQIEVKRPDGTIITIQ
jgi:fibronectin type 3 domain-containing protein